MPSRSSCSNMAEDMTNQAAGLASSAQGAVKKDRHVSFKPFNPETDLRPAGALHPSLKAGDIVRRVGDGKDGQLGYCRSTEVFAVVKVLGTDVLISGVNSVDLLPHRRLREYMLVFYDAKLWSVLDITTELSLRFADGSMCVLSTDAARELEDVIDRKPPNSWARYMNFYKNQRVCGPMRVFRGARWLHRTAANSALGPEEHVQVIVDDVRDAEALLQLIWNARQDAPNEGGQIEWRTKRTIKGKMLESVQVVKSFDHANLNSGKRSYYVCKATDQICSMDEWRHMISQRARTPYTGLRVLPPAPVTTSKLVAWTSFEGSHLPSETPSNAPLVISKPAASSSERQEQGARPSSLKHFPAFPVRMPHNEPARNVCECQLPDPPSMNPGDVVVVEILGTHSTCQVVWQDGRVESGVQSSELTTFYRTDGPEFFPGNIVVETADDAQLQRYGVVKRVDRVAKTAVVGMFKTYTAGADPHPEEIGIQDVSIYDIRIHPDFKFKPTTIVIKVANYEDHTPESTIGEVIDVHQSGKVEVDWLSGKRSLCHPQELYSIAQYDSMWTEDDDDMAFSPSDFVDKMPEKPLQVPPSAPSLFKYAPEWGTFTKGHVPTIPPITIDISQGNRVTFHDSRSKHEKIRDHMEVLRQGMANLEKAFSLNSACLPYSCPATGKLWNFYALCKELDQLMDTGYFQQPKLLAALERVRRQGRLNSPQHVSEHITRHFYTAADHSARNSNLNTAGKKPADEEANKASVACTAEREQSSSAAQSWDPLAASRQLEDEKESLEIWPLCQQIVSTFKSTLLRAHHDFQLRFGMTTAQVKLAASDLALTPLKGPGEPAQATASIEAAEVRPDAELPRAHGEDTAENKCKGTGAFSVMETVPQGHKYTLSVLKPQEPRIFCKVVKREMELLRSSLPDGIDVKGFGDRMDLYSALIRGPPQTPYEDGLFLFDFQLPAKYPHSPPLCHYVAYCNERLNPNLYEEGNVCVSLLSTWAGEGSELWSATNSSLLQVVISIQALILNPEPYYNEPGYEQQRGCREGYEKCRMYNETVVLKVIQSLGRIILDPPETFRAEVEQHVRDRAARFIARLEGWIALADAWDASHPDTRPTQEELRAFAEKADRGSSGTMAFPNYPLLPATKGFYLAVRRALVTFKDCLKQANLPLSSLQP